MNSLSSAKSSRRLLLCLALPALTAAVVLAGCSAEAPTASDAASPEELASLRVVALSPTAGWLLTEIGTRTVEASTLWIEESRELEDDELVRLSAADLIVRHGAGFDRWADTLELDAARIIDLSAGSALIERDGTRHSHGAEGEHTHVEPLPGTWHDPQLLLRALDTLVRRLEEHAPQSVDSARVDALRGRLLRLEDEVEQLAQKIDAVEVDEELAYLERRLVGSATNQRDSTTLQLTTTAEEQGSALLLEPLLPAPRELDYAALLERNMDRIAKALDSP